MGERGAADRDPALLPVGAITATGISLLVAFATGAIFLARRRSIAIATPAPSRAGDRVHEPLVTWGCGYAAPSARMRDALVETYAAVAPPKIVIAVGACATYDLV